MTAEEFRAFIGSRITELRMEKNVSERGMSLELGKSESYIRSITSGLTLPSLKEMFNIVSYFGISITDFFAPAEETDGRYHRLCERLRKLDDEQLDKVDVFLDWIE